MSAEQNIQAAKAGYAAFLREDIPGILALLDENIEWITPLLPNAPGSGRQQGHSGVLAFFQSVNETWDFQAFEPREFIASGDTVVAEGYYRATSRKTGALAESDWAMVWHFQNGKVVKFQEYTDSAALATALTARGAGA